MIGDSLGSTDVKVLGSDDGIKLVYNSGEVIGTTLGNNDGITLWFDVGA